MYAHVTHAIAKSGRGTIPIPVIKQLILPYLHWIWKPGMYCFYETKVARIVKVSNGVMVKGVAVCQHDMEEKKHVCELKTTWSAHASQVLPIDDAFDTPLSITLDASRLPYISTAAFGCTFPGWFYDDCRVPKEITQCLGSVHAVLSQRNVRPGLLPKDCHYIRVGCSFFDSVFLCVQQLLGRNARRFLMGELDKWVLQWFGAFFPPYPMALVYVYQL